jgi:hypothetical protein
MSRQTIPEQSIPQDRLANLSKERPTQNLGVKSSPVHSFEIDGPQRLSDQTGIEVITGNSSISEHRTELSSDSPYFLSPPAANNIGRGRLAHQPDVSLSQSTSRVERSLILKNLPLHVNKLEIWRSLANFGSVEQISKLRRSNPQSMYCYVTMQHLHDAQMLIQSGCFIFRGSRTVRVEGFVPKQSRIATSTVLDTSKHNTKSLELVEPWLRSPGQLLPASLNAQETIACESICLEKIQNVVARPNHHTESSLHGKEHAIILRRGLAIQLAPSLIKERLVIEHFEFSKTQEEHRQFKAYKYEFLDPRSNLRFNIQPVPLI